MILWAAKGVSHTTNATTIPLNTIINAIANTMNVNFSIVTTIMVKMTGGRMRKKEEKTH